MVTAGTYQKKKYFATPTLLAQLTNLLLHLAEAHGWSLRAWAVFPNHYHFLGESRDSKSLRRFTRELHSRSAHPLNRDQNATGRRVWFQDWESQITFHRSFLARLNYIYRNPVSHGIVPETSQYQWCSAGGFERKVPPAFLKTVRSFPIDKLAVPDDFGDGDAP